jgi:ribosomal protein L37AE/L43A
MSEASARVVPYACPFCGEEDLRPAEHDGAAVWHCRSCLRLFSPTFHGLAPASASSLDAPRTTGSPDWSDA